MADASALFLLRNYIATSDRLESTEQHGISGGEALHAHYAGSPRANRNNLGEFDDSLHTRRPLRLDTDLRPERQLQRNLAISKSRHPRSARVVTDASGPGSTLPSGPAGVAAGAPGDPPSRPATASRGPPSAVLTPRAVLAPQPSHAAPPASPSASASAERPASPSQQGQRSGPSTPSRPPPAGGAALWGDTSLELGPAAATAATTAATAASLQDFLLMTAPYEPSSYEEHQRQRHQQQQLLGTGAMTLPGQALSNVPPAAASAAADSTQHPHPHGARRRHGTSVGFSPAAKTPVDVNAGAGVGHGGRHLRRAVTTLAEKPDNAALLAALHSVDGGSAGHDRTSTTLGGLPTAAPTPTRLRPGPGLGLPVSPPPTPRAPPAATVTPVALPSAWSDTAAAAVSPLPSPRRLSQPQQQPQSMSQYPGGHDATEVLPLGSSSLVDVHQVSELPMGRTLIGALPGGSVRRRQRRRLDAEGSGSGSGSGSCATAPSSGDSAVPDTSTAAAAAAVAAAVVNQGGAAAGANGSAARGGGRDGDWEATGLVRRQCTAEGAWWGRCMFRRLWRMARGQKCAKCFARAVHDGKGHPSRVWVCDGVDPRVGGSGTWQALRLDFWSTADKYLPIFLPSFGRSCWDALLLVLLMYTAIVVPMEVGFRSAVTPEIDASHMAVLGVFWVDMFIQCRTAFVSAAGELVRDGRQIAAQYFRTWLTLDLASSIPWAELLMPLLDGSESRAGVLVALARLPRLLRLMRLLRQLDRYRYANALRMVRLMVLLMLIGHWTACAWHAFAEWIPKWPWLFSELTVGASLIQQYSVALYFAYVVVVGSDNPQLPPQNNLERTFMILILILGSIMSALVVSNMAMLVANYNSLSSRYVTKAALAADALRYIGAPPEHRARVAEYYDFLTQHDHPGPDADSFLCELPRGLVEDIKWSLYGSAFNHLWLFSGCAEPFMAALQARLTLSAFTRGEIIFKVQDMGREMFIVRRGCVALRAPSGDLAALLRPGDVFGELALLPDLGARRRSQTAVALGTCDLISLAARDLAAVCKDHPGSGAMVQERLHLQYRHMLSGGSLLWFYDELTAQTETDADYDFDYWFQSGGMQLTQSAVSAADDTKDPTPPADRLRPAKNDNRTDNTAITTATVTPSISTPGYEASRQGLMNTADATAAVSKDGAVEDLDTTADVFATSGSVAPEATGLASRDSSASSWASFFEAANAASSLSAPRVPPTPGLRTRAAPPSLNAATAGARRARHSPSMQRRNDGAAAAAPPLPGAAILESGEAAVATAVAMLTGGGGGGEAAQAQAHNMDSISTAGSLLAAFAAMRSGEFVRQRSSSGQRRRLEAVLRSMSGRDMTGPSRLATASGPAAGVQVAAAVVAAAPSDMDSVAASAAAESQPLKPTAAAAVATGTDPKNRAPTLTEIQSGAPGGDLGGRGGVSEGSLDAAIGGLSKGGYSAGSGGSGGGGAMASSGSKGGALQPHAVSMATGLSGDAVKALSPRTAPPPAPSHVAAPKLVPRAAHGHASPPPAAAPLPAPPPAPPPPPAAPPPPAQSPAPAARAGGRTGRDAAAGGGGIAAGGGGAAAGTTGSSTAPVSQDLSRLPGSTPRLTRPLPTSPFASDLMLSSDEPGLATPLEESDVERDQTQQHMQQQLSVQTPKRGLRGFTSLLRRFNATMEEQPSAGSAGSAGAASGGGEAGGSRGGSDTAGPRGHIAEANGLRPAGSSQMSSATLLAAANASTASAFESSAEERGIGFGMRRLRRFVSGGSRNARPANPVTPSRQRVGSAAADGLGPERRHLYDTAMSTAPAWLIARASRDQWSRRPAVQQYDEVVGRALQTLTMALNADRDASRTGFRASGAVDGEGAAGVAAGRWAGSQLELSAGQKAMLLGIVDYAVRRYGADTTPAIREAIQERVRRVEEHLGDAFKSVLGSLAHLEQMVSSLNEAAAAAKSRLAAIEKYAAEAAGDGVLAPNLLGLLDTDSGLNIALERLQQAGASGSSSWSEALLASGLASFGGRVSYVGAAAAAAAAAAPPPPVATKVVGAPSRAGSDAIVRRRSSGFLRYSSQQSSVLSDAQEGTETASSPKPSDRRPGSVLLPVSSPSSRVSAGGSLSSSPVVGGGGAAAAAAAAMEGDAQRPISSVPPATTQLHEWRQVLALAAMARRRSVDSPQQTPSQLRRGDTGNNLTGKERPVGSGSGVAGIEQGSFSSGSRRTSAEQRRASIEQRRSSEHRRSLPNATQGAASVDGKQAQGPDGTTGAAATAAAVPGSAAPVTSTGGANTSSSRHQPPASRSLPSASVGSGAPLQRPSPHPGHGMALRPGGAARTAVLYDSVVRDSLGGGSRQQQPTLLPSERPGARRALTPSPGLRTTENAPVPDGPPPLTSGNSGVVWSVPYRRASTSVLQPQLTMLSAASSGAGGGGSMVILAPPQIALNPVGTAQPSRTAAARVAAAAAAATTAAAGTSEAEPAGSGSGASGTATAFVRRKGSRGPLGGDVSVRGGEVSVRGGDTSFPGVKP